MGEGTVEVLTSARTFAIKIGSSLITSAAAADSCLERISKQVAELVAQDRRVVLISSGSIAEGAARIGLKRRPRRLHELQALAAIGQVALMTAYENAFKQYGLDVGQVLVTHDDLKDRLRYFNARQTLITLMRQKVVPIINENDSVSTEEIKFGDNDTLASRVATMVDASVLVLLTDQPGFCSEDPRKNASAKLIRYRNVFDTELDYMAGHAPGDLGRGGMVTKLQAARFAARAGCHTVILDGRANDGLVRLRDGDCSGTMLTTDLRPMVKRKLWIAGQLDPKGAVVIDDGAVRAVIDQGASLLPVGVVNVEGDFSRGDLILVQDRQGREIARGLSNFDSTDIRKIKGKRSDVIEAMFDYAEEREVMHRDNLVAHAISAN